MTRNTLISLAALAALLIVVHAILGWSILPDSYDSVVNFTWVEVPIYLLAVVIVLRDHGDHARRGGLTLILLVAAVLRIMLVPVDPESTDINRYIWDGRVQGARINPFVYLPVDPALKFLRDDEIYPDINRKEYAPTIYPPLAQIVFFLTTRISEQIWVMKAVMVAFDGLAIWALLRLMALRKVPSGRILIYAWHPVPVWQFAADGHVDAVMVACLCLALLAAEARRPILAGIALGGATMTKIYPVLIGPSLYRRWDWRLPIAGFLTIVVLYLPYVGAGRKLLGFSSGYSAEEGFTNGTQLYPWLLLKHIVPGLPQTAFALYWPVAALILGGLGLVVLFRERGDPIDLFGGFMLATVFAALTSPHYIWYMAWLIPFLCFYQSWSVFWLTGAATFMNVFDWPPKFLGGSLVFLPFFAIAVCEIVVASKRRRKASITRSAGSERPIGPPI